jgi:hypothetical protein
MIDSSMSKRSSSSPRQFGCILAWLAFGSTHSSFSTLKRSSVEIRAGNAMSTIAVAATISMLGFGLGAYGLHRRIKEADRVWKEENYHANLANMPQPEPPSRGIENRPGSGIIGQFRASRVSSYAEQDPQQIKARLSDYSEAQREKGSMQFGTRTAQGRPMSENPAVVIVDERGEESLISDQGQHDKLDEEYAHQVRR